MQELKTIMEKAAEWDMSPRHIQYLCKGGKVAGAVKRAGSWFIPDDTPSPAMNTKSSATGFDFVGTKKRLFESAIQLFLSRGFDNVTIRDIASSVGIRQSTVYNHFASKQAILDTVYDFYCHYYLDNRPSLEEMEPKLQNGGLDAIIGCIRYEFKEAYIQRLSDITKIIFQRISIDDRAREIAKSLIIDAGMQYVESIFDRLNELGRFGGFDSHKMAVFLNSTRVFALVRWIIDPSPDNITRLTQDEAMACNVIACL